jgi:Rod binding domain-containing protein
VKLQPAPQILQQHPPTPNLARTPASQLSDHDKLVHQTQVWVAQTFFGTLLKQMHESPFRSEMFDGGRGGQAFSSLYDQHLSERMARGAGSKLVRSIVRKIEAAGEYRKQQKAVAPAASTGTSHDAGRRAA